MSYAWRISPPPFHSSSRCSWNNNLPVSRTFVTFLLLLYVSSHATASWTFYCTINCFNCLYSSKTHLSRRLLLPSPVPRHPTLPGDPPSLTVHLQSHSTNRHRPPVVLSLMVTFPEFYAPSNQTTNSNRHNLAACAQNIMLDFGSDGATGSGPAKLSLAANPTIHAVPMKLYSYLCLQILNLNPTS